MVTRQRGTFPPLAATPVRRKRAAHDRVLTAIGLGIVRGEYPADTLLPGKDRLMRELDVSQTALREALQTLAAKGMITARARIGTTVLGEKHWNMFDADVLGWRLEAGLGASVLGMLMEIRQGVEPLAAAMAAGRRDEADLARLRAAVERMRAARRRRRDFVEADLEFHRALLDASGNAFLGSLSALVSAALSASLTQSAPEQDEALAMHVADRHAAIVEAIAAGDSEKAGRAITTVITEGWMRIGGVTPRRIGAIDLLRFPPSRRS